MTSAPPEPKLQPKNPGVEKPEGFFVKNSCIVRKSDNPHFGALLPAKILKCPRHSNLPVNNSCNLYSNIHQGSIKRPHGASKTIVNQG